MEIVEKGENNESLKKHIFRHNEKDPSNEKSPRL